MSGLLRKHSGPWRMRPPGPGRSGSPWSRANTAAGAQQHVREQAPSGVSQLRLGVGSRPAAVSKRWPEAKKQIGEHI